MAISDWRPEERPRERLLARGARSLSDAELVAIILRTGLPNKSAVDLADDLLKKFGSVAKMLESDLRGIKGLGPAKTAQFAAAFEILRRSLDEKLKERSALTSPGAVRDYLRLTLGRKDEEIFVCLWLDAQHKVIGVQEAFHGTLTQTSVYPREIVKAALARNAAAVIFAHNHPSGVAEPSSADRTLTERLKSALAQVDIRVLDHFVVGEQVVSFAERGWI